MKVVQKKKTKFGTLVIESYFTSQPGKEKKNFRNSVEYSASIEDTNADIISIFWGDSN